MVSLSCSIALVLDVGLRGDDVYRERKGIPGILEEQPEEFSVT